MSLPLQVTRKECAEVALDMVRSLCGTFDPAPPSKPLLKNLQTLEMPFNLATEGPRDSVYPTSTPQSYRPWYQCGVQEVPLLWDRSVVGPILSDAAQPHIIARQY